MAKRKTKGSLLGDKSPRAAQTHAHTDAPDTGRQDAAAAEETAQATGAKAPTATATARTPGQAAVVPTQKKAVAKKPLYKFLLLAGTHYDADGKKYSHTKGQVTIVPSDKRLDQLFAGKFRRLNNSIDEAIADAEAEASRQAQIPAVKALSPQQEAQAAAQRAEEKAEWDDWQDTDEGDEGADEGEDDE